MVYASLPFIINTLYIIVYCYSYYFSFKGIGKQVARFVSSFNAKRVILAVRNMEKGQSVVNYIHSITNKNNCEAWNLDCAELNSVRAFAKKVVEEIGEVQVLINNAGTLYFRKI